MKKNPFSLSFGKEDWIVIDLNPERDLLQSFAANLSNYPSLSEVFREAKINLSFLGLGVEIEGASPITDLNVAVTRMLEKIKKKHKRVLVTIDEAVCNDTMKEFVSLFQIYMRQDLPVFLLMTGLYENIYELQNEKTLTFLYRAPKIELRPLNIGMRKLQRWLKRRGDIRLPSRYWGIFVLSIIPDGIMYYLNSVSIWRNMYMKRYGVSCQKVIRNCWLLWQKPMTPKWKQYERL